MRLVGLDLDSVPIVADLADDGFARPIAPVDDFWADPVTALSRSDIGPPVDVTAVRRVPPVPRSARVICVGLNYRSHVAEGPFAIPTYPEYFGRWTSALGVPGEAVIVPDGEPGLDWEAELAVIVGRPLRDVSEDEAIAGVFGYAAFNDLTARRAQHRGVQWTLGKNVDRSGILGPIRPASELGDPRRGWRIGASVNGEVVQESTTDRLIFGIAQLLADLASVMTLHPGDVLATGTPEGVGHRRVPPRFLRDGDVVTASVEGLDPITTPIVERATVQ